MTLPRREGLEEPRFREPALTGGRTTTARPLPFTIRLRDRVGGDTQDVSLKLDPGAKTTGMALVRKDGTDPRAGYRRRRRSANLRYRQPRFLNRRSDRQPPPSLRSRVDNVVSWTVRTRRMVPVTSIAVETVRFDTQRLENPEIRGTECRRGTLAGYDVREYLLEKWDRTCAYCGARDVPLQIDHVRPKAAGGSDRVSSLALAFRPRNQSKGAQPVRTFLVDRPDRLRKVLAQLKTPLASAAAVNVTRSFLLEALQRTGLPVTGSSGGLTEYNRTRLGIPKTRALDAARVGDTPVLTGWRQPVLEIRAMGRGSYRRIRVNRFGFPVGYLTRGKTVHGFRTGDIVRATVPSGRNRGVHVGRVAVRRTGSFSIQTDRGTVQGISRRHCRTVHRADGYGYGLEHQEETPTMTIPRDTAFLPAPRDGVSRGED